MRERVLGLSVLLVILLNAATGASAATGTGAGSAAGPSAGACDAPPPALGKYRATAPGRELPAAPWIGGDGKERPIEELRGEGLVLNFWATWCAPCVKEMPSLDRLAQQAEAGGFRVLALSADREGAAVVRSFYDINRIGRLAVAVDKTSRVARAAAITGLPTTVLYDADGREIGRVLGVAEWDAPATVTFLSACLGRRP